MFSHWARPCGQWRSWRQWDWEISEKVHVHRVICCSRAFSSSGTCGRSTRRWRVWESNTVKSFWSRMGWLSPPQPSDAHWENLEATLQWGSRMDSSSSIKNYQLISQRSMLYCCLCLPWLVNVIVNTSTSTFFRILMHSVSDIFGAAVRCEAWNKEDATALLGWYANTATWSTCLISHQRKAWNDIQHLPMNFSIHGHFLTRFALPISEPSLSLGDHFGSYSMRTLVIAYSRLLFSTSYTRPQNWKRKRLHCWTLIQGSQIWATPAISRKGDRPSDR